MKAAPVGEGMDRALRYGNHRSAAEYLPAIREKLSEYVRRQKCLVIQKSAAHEIQNLRVSHLAAVVTHKVRIITDFSLRDAERTKNKRTQRRHKPGHRSLMFVRRSTTQIAHGTSQP